MHAEVLEREKRMCVWNRKTWWYYGRVAFVFRFYYGIKLTLAAVLRRLTARFSKTLFSILN